MSKLLCATISTQLDTYMAKKWIDKHTHTLCYDGESGYSKSYYWNTGFPLRDSGLKYIPGEPLLISVGNKGAKDK